MFARKKRRSSHAAGCRLPGVKGGIVMKGTRRTYRKNRRMQRARRRMMVFGAVVLLTGLLVSALSAIQVHADTSEEEPRRYKYFTSVFVERDDTLWDLATEYRTEEYADVREYVDEVMHINHLTDEQLQYGDWITVPYYSSELK